MTTAETLLDVFVPPDGMVGHSAALVAMTGAEDFLEAAVQRFTGLRPRQRAELGNVLVYLMLDGHASASRPSVLPPGRIPGLHELYPRSIGPGSLLHAKLALLAFAASRTGGPCHLRLAVLSANFTYMSATQQLELVWVVDVPLDGTARPQERTDVTAAATFVRELIERRFYQEEGSLPLKQRRLTSRLDSLLAVATELEPSNQDPRFTHSLDRPLYEQIRECFQEGVEAPRNLLLCGSGFYEEPTTKARKPDVFKKLEDLGVFTANVRRIALVEPQEAGAVAAWAKKGPTEGWELVHPTDALARGRRLHAKFVYVGYLRDGFASNGWLYLGSGNLSRRGLLTSGLMPEGNVECGVVFAVADRFDGDQLARHLFWDASSAEAVEDDEWQVGQVGDAPESAELVETPPILLATIELLPERVLRPLWRPGIPNGVRASVAWTGSDWRPVEREQRLALKDGDAPGSLRVRTDDSTREWTVPVVDPAGRVCWQPPRFATYADAIAALLDFPIRPAEATDDEDDIEDGGGGAVGPLRGGGIADEKSYALHAAAELIEKVAALQLALPGSMLDDWLEHLDRIFRGSFPEGLVATWREHGMDVFSHLREPELRSPHLTEKQRLRYFEVLDDTARAWGLR